MHQKAEHMKLLFDMMKKGRGLLDGAKVTDVAYKYGYQSMEEILWNIELKKNRRFIWLA